MNEKIARLLRRQGPRALRRRGTAALEEVLVLAWIIPVVLAAFFLSRWMCVYVYKIISTLVGWPYL